MSKQKEPIVTSMEKSERFCNVETVTVQLKALMENVFGMAEPHCAVHEVERALWQGVLALGRELSCRLSSTSWAMATKALSWS